jgi:hypothetical protein
MRVEMGAAAKLKAAEWTIEGNASAWAKVLVP